MPSWKGNPNNPSPNPIQEEANLSEKPISENRSIPARRDTDKQKNFTITFFDIDSTIMNHLEKLQISVVDEGNNIKVPIFYGSPDKWVAARRDGVIRDKQGKLILPAIILKRTNSDNDANIQTFNRYLRYPVMKVYSSKNKYTPFNVLNNTNVPVHEIYNVVLPDHMIFTYHFIVWTEYQEQMNDIIQKIKINTEDYWGDAKRFKFRVLVDAFTHTIELQNEQNRIVKTEFDLVTHGYLLPDEIYYIGQGRHETTEKSFTAKKVIITAETVNTSFDLSTVDKSKEGKIKSQQFPNLDAGTEPPAPTPIVRVGDELTNEEVNKFKEGLKCIGINNIQIWQKPPTNSTDPGEEGWLAYDENYYYIFINGQWRRVPISLFNTFPTFS